MLKDLYIEVLKKEPNKKPEIIRIRNEVPRIQKILGGKFEILEYTKDIFIMYNVESKKDELKSNITINGKEIKGDIIFIGNNIKEGDFRKLKENEMKQIDLEFTEHIFVENEL